MLTKIIPFAVLIACVLGVLYLGIATPSEAAGVGALLAIILVALLYRSVNARNLMDIALETTRTSTMILMIVAFSAVLGQILEFPQRSPGAGATGGRPSDEQVGGVRDH